MIAACPRVCLLRAGGRAEAGADADAAAALETPGLRGGGELPGLEAGHWDHWTGECQHHRVCLISGNVWECQLVVSGDTQSSLRERKSGETLECTAVLLEAPDTTELFGCEHPELTNLHRHPNVCGPRDCGAG